MFVAVSPLPKVADRVRNESLVRILLGTMTFLCVATSTSWLVAELQNYQLGIFGTNWVLSIKNTEELRQQIPRSY
jgi:hypothetical protein